MAKVWLVLSVIIALILSGCVNDALKTKNYTGNKTDFSGVTVNGWELDSDGTMKVQLSNKLGSTIKVNTASVKIGSATASLSGLPTILKSGESTSTLYTQAGALDPQSSGSDYSADIIIDYTDVVSNIESTSSGTLTGSAFSKSSS
jgi:hypothetical protein